MGRHGTTHPNNVSKNFNSFEHTQVQKTMKNIDGRTRVKKSMLQSPKGGGITISLMLHCQIKDLENSHENDSFDMQKQIQKINYY